jgi:hypothetical protein
MLIHLSIFVRQQIYLPLTIASIDVPFRGRTFKVAGDRSIDVWTVTVINDEDFKLRRSFEAWMELNSKT